MPNLATSKVIVQSLTWTYLFEWKTRRKLILIYLLFLITNFSTDNKVNLPPDSSNVPTPLSELDKSDNVTPPVCFPTKKVNRAPEIVLFFFLDGNERANIATFPKFRGAVGKFERWKVKLKQHTLNLIKVTMSVLPFVFWPKKINRAPEIFCIFFWMETEGPISLPFSSSGVSLENLKDERSN